MHRKGIQGTYHSLDNVSKVVGHCNKQGSLFGVVGADLIDPTQDERTCAILLLLLDVMFKQFVKN